MTNAEIVEVHSYRPPGVSEIIARGGGTFIGAVDDTTVLKYPLIPDDRESIETEARLLEVLGEHPRTIASRGLTVTVFFCNEPSMDAWMTTWSLSPQYPSARDYIGVNKPPKHLARYTANASYIAT